MMFFFSICPHFSIFPLLEFLLIKHSFKFSSISHSSFPQLIFTIKMSSSFDSTIVWLIERTAFGFVLITLPFYSLILVVIGWECFKNDNGKQSSKYLSSPFFRLMFVTGIVDITILLNNYFGSVFPKWGLFPSIYLNPKLESILSHLYIGLAWSTGLSHTICVLAVALNRMVAILTLFKYKKIWTANITRIFCAFQIFPGLGICAMIFKDPTHYVLQADGISIVARNFNESATRLYFLIGAICTAVGCFLSAITYAISFIKLYQYRRKLLLSFPSSNYHQPRPRSSSSLNSRMSPTNNQQSLAQINNSNNFNAGEKQQQIQMGDQQMNKQRAEEMRLFMLALIICMVEFILASLLALHNFVHNPLWIAAFNLLTDLFSVINPYLLWKFSQPLRQKTVILLIGFPGPYQFNLLKWRRKTTPTQPNDRQTPAAIPPT